MFISPSVLISKLKASTPTASFLVLKCNPAHFIKGEALFAYFDSTQKWNCGFWLNQSKGHPTTDENYKALIMFWVTGSVLIKDANKRCVFIRENLKKNIPEYHHNVFVWDKNEGWSFDAYNIKAVAFFSAEEGGTGCHHVLVVGN